MVPAAGLAVQRRSWTRVCVRPEGIFARRSTKRNPSAPLPNGLLRHVRVPRGVGPAGHRQQRLSDGGRRFLLASWLEWPGPAVRWGPRVRLGKLGQICRLKLLAPRFVRRRVQRCVWLWQRSAGAERVFHWGYTFDDGLAAANPGASGATATTTAVDHLGVGLDAWCDGTAAGCNGDGVGEMVLDTPSQLDPSYNNTLGAFRVAQPKGRALNYLVCAFSGNYQEHSAVDLTLRISAADPVRSRSGTCMTPPLWS